MEDYFQHTTTEKRQLTARIKELEGQLRGVTQQLTQLQAEHAGCAAAMCVSQRVCCVRTAAHNPAHCPTPHLTHVPVCCSAEGLDAAKRATKLEAANTRLTTQRDSAKVTQSVCLCAASSMHPARLPVSDG